MTYLPFDINYLPEELVEIARKELGETEDVKKKTIIQLRKLIEEESNLYSPLDDNALLEFLRPRKFNVKRAFSLYRNFYHLKTGYRDVFDKPLFDVFLRCNRDEIFRVMPYRDKDGTLILVAQLNNWNYKEIKFSGLLHAVATVANGCVILQPATQVCGIKILVDTRGLGLGYATQISPRLLRLVSQGLLNAFPGRFKAIHILNNSQIIQSLWNIIRYFLSDKLKSRMLFHTSLESVHKHLHPDLLPEDFGGKIKYDNSTWMKYCENLEPTYYERMKYGYTTRKSSIVEGLKD